MRLLIAHGPNLNLLGQREPETYGHETLAHLTSRLERLAEELGVTLEHVQSNHEGVMIERIHQAWRDGLHGVVINPGGWTHGSVSLRDALAATCLPFVEVHVSNVHAREPFRRHSLFSDVARGVVVGFGTTGYLLALRGLVEMLASEG